MKTVLILGAGVAGCATAYLLQKKGFDVTVLEGAPRPGGGVWTQYYGGHPYTFGPRVFFSPDDEVVSHLMGLIKMREFYTQTWTYVESDGNLYNYPLQYSDIPLMPDGDEINRQLEECKGGEVSVENFESYWLSVIGPNLYRKFVNDYSKKMWEIESNKQLSANFEWVNRGTPIRDGDQRLYGDQFQGYPEAADGFNQYFLSCLADVTVHYGAYVHRFYPDERVVELRDGQTFTGDVVVNTIHVDSLFGNEYGRLQFSGRQFIPLWLPCKQAMPDDVTWIHYSGTEAHTRVTEFKKVTGYESNSTLLGVELPSPQGRYYPVQTQAELTRFAQYQQMFPDGFFSIGRMGKFRYQGIPDGIRDALDLSAKL